MTLQEYLGVVLDRWRVVLAVLVLVVIVSGSATAFATPTYTARSEVFFSVGVGDNPRELRNGFPYAQGLARSYARVATLPVVLGPVKERLGLDTDLDQLARAVTARAPIDTVLVEIITTTPVPQRSSDIANAVADQLAVVIERLSPAVSGRQPSFSAATVSPAATPRFASTPRVGLNLSLAVIFGLLGGTALAVAVESRDARAWTGRSAGGVVPARVVATFERQRLGPMWRLGRPRGPDRATPLGMALTDLRRDHNVRSIMLASDDDTTLESLISALRETDLRGLIIDADVRRPTLAALFGVAQSMSLTSVLRGDSRWPDAVRGVPGATLAVLPAGPPGEADPGLSTSASAMSRLISETTGRYELVLLKAPSLLDTADALVISRLVDGVVVVVDGRVTRRSTLAEEIGALDLVGARFLGVVVSD